jgi:hypothetical protein
MRPFADTGTASPCAARKDSLEGFKTEKDTQNFPTEIDMIPLEKVK